MFCNVCFRSYSKCTCSDTTGLSSRPYLPPTPPNLLPRLALDVRPVYDRHDWNRQFGCHHLMGPGFGPK